MRPGMRYAIYWAPEREHPLWRSGCAWLGRDPESADPSNAAGDRTARAHVESPRRYGFHATLKPPMALRVDAGEADVVAALQRIAARTPAFTMPALEVALLRDFVALRPRTPMHASHPLRRLADVCVSELDPLRRTPTAVELQRRLQGQPLDADEQANVQRWGYPYVFRAWQFHLTLSDGFGPGPADRAACDRLLTEAHQHFEDALATPLHCESVAMYVEPRPGAPFVLARRVPLAGPA